jgi:hypothetical protein
MAKARGRAPARRTETIDRLHQNEWGVWHWKVEKKLRPHFKGCSLGRDRAAAEAEAGRLNREVEAFLKAREAGTAAPARRFPQRRKGQLTIGQLISLWRYGEDGKGSDDWRSKRETTRRQWAHYLKAIEAEFGDEAANGLRRGRVLQWSDPLKRATPGTARSYVSCARALYSWAMYTEILSLEANPFALLRIPGAKKRKALFTLDDIRHVVAVADGRLAPPARELPLPPHEDGRARRDRGWKPRPSLGTALVLAFACIQRASDVIALDETHLAQQADGSARLVFDQSKSKRVGQRFELSPGVHIDMRLPQLAAARLRADPPKAPRGGNTRLLVVNEITGRRYDERTVGHAFAKLIARAIAVDPQRWGHLQGLQLRDGRRSGFVHLRKLGLTVEQIVNMSGHTLKEGYEIVEHYLPRTADEADAAAAFMTGEL